ncbi:hypothetical protein SCA6_002989 [Theobroma cacao]
MLFSSLFWYSGFFVSKTSAFLSNHQLLRGSFILDFNTIPKIVTLLFCFGHEHEMDLAGHWVLVDPHPANASAEIDTNLTTSRLVNLMHKESKIKLKALRKVVDI